MSCREDRSLFDQIATARLRERRHSHVCWNAGFRCACLIFSIWSWLESSWRCSPVAWVVFSTVSAVYAGLLVRQSRAELHSIFLMVGEGVGLLAALFGLMSGWGIFALAFGKFCMQITYLALRDCNDEMDSAPALALGCRARTCREFSRYILATRMRCLLPHLRSDFHYWHFSRRDQRWLLPGGRAPSIVLCRVDGRTGPSDRLGLVSGVPYGKSIARVELKKKCSARKRRYSCRFCWLLAAPIFIGLATRFCESSLCSFLANRWHPAATAHLDPRPRLYALCSKRPNRAVAVPDRDRCAVCHSFRF